MQILYREKLDTDSSMWMASLLQNADFWTLDEIQKSLNRTDSFLMFCFDKKIPIGFAIWTHSFESSDLIYLFVNTQYRQKGLGALLMKMSHRELKRRNINQVILEVRQTNVGAIKLYSSLGYEKIREIKNYYGKGIDGFVMQKKIGLKNDD